MIRHRTHQKSPSLKCTLYILGAWLAVGAFGQETNPLEALLTQAAANNGQIREAGADVEAARSQVALARAAAFPRASALLVGAPLFEEHGDPSKSTANFSNWGPFIKAGF